MTNVAVYVDDLGVMSSSLEMSDTVKKVLSGSFKMNYMGASALLPGSFCSSR